ncbi:MAG: Eco57I restriction-modification methylase domain-containing protein, partial [Planctomycetota bacterium]
KVYTPAPLAAEVVRRTLAPLAGRAGLRILDPACGDGVFLREACRHVDPRCIVGMDIDAAAVARARRELPGADLRVGDALRHDWRERFDAVIGNPPWVSWSGRHARPLAERDRRYYTARFETFAGWPSLHGLFLELAVRLARGRVGLLLPGQVCELAGYGPVRAFVRRHCRVAAVLDCGEESFAGVTQPCCALFLEAGGSEGGSAPFWGQRDVDHELLGHLAAFPKPPRAAFGDIGVHTGNCARKLLRPGGLPIREGRDVHPFRLDPPRKTLVDDPARAKGDYFRIGAHARFLAVPIVLRQTAERPVAALHEKPAYFRNSVLACHGIPGVDPALVVAWLNSSVVGWYHRTRVRESGQRVFPQLKVRHLRDLPAPRWETAPPELTRLAGAIAPSGPVARLDAMMSAWFGLDAATHARIRAG